ncbi:MAG: hypothetical protein BWY49_00090 [Candidatus Omnitrophica bacterium ADurb.Bin314]|nr:MAG: hypothetical protein BWY49_00090 [Candidatus Omnitrophica bacterium ADurb.Bin314]
MDGLERIACFHEDRVTLKIGENDIPFPASKIRKHDRVVKSDDPGQIKTALEAFLLLVPQTNGLGERSLILLGKSDRPLLDPGWRRQSRSTIIPQGSDDPVFKVPGLRIHVILHIPVERPGKLGMHEERESREKNQKDRRIPDRETDLEGVNPDHFSETRRYPVPRTVSILKSIFFSPNFFRRKLMYTSIVLLIGSKWRSQTCSAIAVLETTSPS